MKIEITSPENLIELLTWALEDAPILNKELNTKISEFNDSIQSSITVTGAGEISNSVENLQEVLNAKVANYIIERYDTVFVTDDEKLIGTEGNKTLELYDGSGRKLYSDASML